MRKAPAEMHFDPPHLAKREAGVLRSALIKYAKDCDVRFQEADSPQDAYAAGIEAEIARELAVRIVKAEQPVSRTIQAPTLRPVR